MKGISFDKNNLIERGPFSLYRVNIYGKGVHTIKYNLVLLKGAYI